MIKLKTPTIQAPAFLCHVLDKDWLAKSSISFCTYGGGVSWMNRYHGPASWTFSINWLLRGIVFLVQSVPKEGLNWPKLTNVCKLCKVESVLPIVTASQQKRKKKLDKCIQTQWSVLPTVAVSQQARPFYIRDDYLSQHTKGNNWLRRFVITCRQTIGGRLLCM